MKLCKCKDCGNSKQILIETNSFAYEYLCSDCWNLKHSTNYFLRKQDEKREAADREYIIPEFIKH